MSKKIVEWSSRRITPCQRGLQCPRWKSAELPKSSDEDDAKTAVAILFRSPWESTTRTVPATKLSGNASKCSQPRNFGLISRAASRNRSVGGIDTLSTVEPKFRACTGSLRLLSSSHTLPAPPPCGRGEREVVGRLSHLRPLRATAAAPAVTGPDPRSH